MLGYYKNNDRLIIINGFDTIENVNKIHTKAYFLFNTFHLNICGNITLVFWYDTHRMDKFCNSYYLN